MSSQKGLIGRPAVSGGVRLAVSVGLRSAAAGVTLGLLPAAAAMALGGNDIMVATAPAQPLCANSATEPMTVPIDSQPDVMKGAPYSGVGTTEVVTTLADGNRITRTNTMKYYRDSAGRTRTEYQLAAIGPFVPEEAQSIVTITDPVSKQHYVLHPGMKRADVFKMGMNGGPTRATGNAIFVGSANASVNGGPQVVGFGSGVPGTRATLAQGVQGRIEKRGTSRSADPAQGITSSSFNSVAGADGHRMTVRTVEDAPDVLSTQTAGPPGSFNLLVVNNGTPMQVCKGGAKAAEPTSIGEKRIEGLKVTGSRLEFTLDAGTVGNDQPITVRTDQWFSPDLGVVVSSMNHDPMIGDTTYRLEQINRAEPDASLFQVPADYAKSQMPF